MREVSLHILDLVQNAVEAGAGRVRILLREDRVRDWLVLRVADNGRGMDAESCRLALDPFYSTRRTRRVGLGLPLIDMSTARCGGRLLVRSKPGQGTTVAASWRLGHMDRPPLGNLTATLKTLIIGNAERDLAYTHQVDRRRFCLSVRQLRGALAGIPFTQPDVLTWLDGYITANERLVYGGVRDEDS
ncbi:MAG: ATP-binding protein [Sporomusaceae bacterium]|nr:ATP-binding protein [Sporomusaceae bacterium]